MFLKVFMKSDKIFAPKGNIDQKTSLLHDIRFIHQIMIKLSIVGVMVVVTLVKML